MSLWFGEVRLEEIEIRVGSSSDLRLREGRRGLHLSKGGLRRIIGGQFRGKVGRQSRRLRGYGRGESLDQANMSVFSLQQRI